MDSSRGLSILSYTRMSLKSNLCNLCRASGNQTWLVYHYTQNSEGACDGSRETAVQVCQRLHEFSALRTKFCHAAYSIQFEHRTCLWEAWCSVASAWRTCLMQPALVDVGREMSEPYRRNHGQRWLINMNSWIELSAQNPRVKWRLNS